jgi:TusA-related sulfurtransferase
MPIIKTAEQIQKMAVGEILEVIADDEGITSDMPSWCQITGHEFLKIEKLSSEYHTFVKKIV